MRTFKVTEPRPNGLPNLERTYKGFDKQFDPILLEHVVLVSIEGEIEVFAVDDPRKVSGLVEYLTDHHGEHCVLIGAYSRK